MTRFEIKKVFAKRGSWLALAVIILMLVVELVSTVNTAYWVNADGEIEKGFGTIQKLREAKREWAGMLTEEQIARVLNENTRLNQISEQQSIQAQNAAFHHAQGFLDIFYLISCSFGDFQELDLTAADHISPNMAGSFYQNRLDKLSQWLLYGDGQGQFTEKEMQFLTEQYEQLNTPFFYTYQDGWKQLFNLSTVMIVVTAIVLGILCSGIFSDEFRYKSDAIFYSSCQGRNKAVAAKLKAGLLIVTAIYWTVMFLFSAAVLVIFGADGANCPIQSIFYGWNSFYNLTNGQLFLLILVGGYLSCVFISAVTMLVSAAARSSIPAVIMPFVFIFLPTILPDALSKIKALLPDQLLQLNQAVRYFNLYELGGRIFSAVPMLFAIYLPLALLIIPITYSLYKKHQID